MGGGALKGSCDEIFVVGGFLFKQFLLLFTDMLSKDFECCQICVDFLLLYLSPESLLEFFRLIHFVVGAGSYNI